MAVADTSTPSVIVAERSRRVDLMWGFLTVVFAAALERGCAAVPPSGGGTSVMPSASSSCSTEPTGLLIEQSSGY